MYKLTDILNNMSNSFEQIFNPMNQKLWVSLIQLEITKFHQT